jgi:hypothetical protein
MNNADYLSDESFYINDFHRKIAQIRTIKEGATSKSSVSTNVGRPSAAWGIIRFRPDGKSPTWTPSGWRTPRPGVPTVHLLNDIIIYQMKIFR